MSKQLTRDVYFRSDIENALSAIQYVNDSLAFELYEEDVHIYKAGFDAALIAVAKAFGIGSANHPIKNFIPVDPCSHQDVIKNPGFPEVLTSELQDRRKIVRTFDE